jgi:hypothetical protein
MANAKIVKVYHATVTHIPAYWSRVCYCTIPEHWTGEVVLKKTAHSLSRACADGETRDEVVASLICQLKDRGLTGKLRINRA